MHATAGHYPYCFILVMLCETSNYMVVEPLCTVQTPEICEAIRHVALFDILAHPHM